MADKKTWNVYIGIPGEDIERVQANYKGVPVRQKFTVDDDIEPTVNDVYKTFPWAKEGNYAVRVQEDPASRRKDGEDGAWEAFQHGAAGVYTWGGSDVARSAYHAATQDELPFSEAMGEAAARDEALEAEHPWASLAGAGAGLGLALGGDLAVSYFSGGTATPVTVPHAVGATAKAASLASRVLRRQAPRAAAALFRAALPGMVMKTTKSLSKGEVPTTEELVDAGTDSAAVGAGLNVLGASLSYIPAVNKLGPGLARIANKKNRVAKRTQEGFNVAKSTNAAKNDKLFVSKLLSNQPSAGATEGTVPLYAGYGEDTNNLLASIKANNTKAAESLAESRVRPDLMRTEKDLNKAVIDYLGSKTGVGSPDNVAYRMRALNDKYAGLTESLNTYKSKPLMLRIAKGKSPTKAESDLISELERMQAMNELRFGMSFDPATGSATPAAIMEATGNITKNGSRYTSRQQKAASDAGLSVLKRNRKFIGVGKDVPVDQYADDYRTLFREANAFNEGKEAVSSGITDLDFFINGVPPEISDIQVMRGSQAAEKAQKGVVDARRSGIMSNYLSKRNKVTPKGTLPPAISPDSQPVIDMMSSTEKGAELLHQMAKRDGLMNSLLILTDPKLRPKNITASLMSRLIRAAIGKTGTYSLQNAGLGTLQATVYELSRSDTSKLASLMRQNASKLAPILSQKTPMEVFASTLARARALAATSDTKEAKKARKVRKDLTKDVVDWAKNKIKDYIEEE